MVLLETGGNELERGSRLCDGLLIILRMVMWACVCVDVLSKVDDNNWNLTDCSALFWRRICHGAWETLHLMRGREGGKKLILLLTEVGEIPSSRT